MQIIVYQLLKQNSRVVWHPGEFNKYLIISVLQNTLASQGG